MGTIVNVVAVILGSLIGLFLNGGIPEKIQNGLMTVLGFSTIFIGVSGALSEMLVIGADGSISSQGTLMMIISLVIGTVIGTLMDIERRMEEFGSWIKAKVKMKENPLFVEGFMTASLVICVGAMAVVGALQDGLQGNSTMLFTKSILDFVVVIIFASTMGIGVLFSAIPLGIYQGAITLFAGAIAPFMTDLMIANLNLVGSVMIFGIGTNLAFDTKVKVANMLPGLLICVLWTLVF